LSAIARHAELLVQGMVLQVADCGAQRAASGAKGRQLGAGNSPGLVVHWPALAVGGGGGAELLEQANIATSTPNAHVETPKLKQVL
jgi:hypothetical protein